MQGRSIATEADLRKLVGYRQLRELYGWPERTVQEWIKARKFPKPLNMPGRENYWALDDIVAWMKGDLTRVAVSLPEDLDIEKIEMPQWRCSCEPSRTRPAGLSTRRGSAT